MAATPESCAPIALFVYNRPSHTKLTVEALLGNVEAQYSKLYIFSDAARDEHAAKAVNEVRQYISQIQGFLEVNIIESEFNKGLASSIIDGVTQLCDTFGRVIVLEDDLVASPHFLSFMNNGLSRYEHEEKVMQIAGYMFPVELNVDEDALFMPFTSSWGWATWRKTWQKFDATAKGYSLLKQSTDLRRQFDLGGSYPYFKMLKSQQKGKTNSWAIRWYLSVFLNQGLTLYPKQTMVQNIGFDGTGENCLVSSILEYRIDPEFKVVAFPENVQVSIESGYVQENLPKVKPKLSLVFERVKRAIW